MNVITWAWRAIAGGIRAEIHGWEHAKAIIAELETQTPSPGPRSMPGDGPNPAAGTPAHPEAAAEAPRPAPLPGPPRLLMTSRFYSDGVVFVDNHITRKTTKFSPPPEEPDLSDEALERFIRDCRD